MNLPQIILLNGACSSGKTTLAQEFLKVCPAPYFYYSSDQLVGAGVLPVVDRKIKKTPRSWDVIRPKFFDGFHRSIEGFASAGNLILVEHIVEYKDWLRALVLYLAPFSVFYIGVMCPLEEMERREKMRGDRAIGEARSHLEDGIHTWSKYDLEIDTHLTSAEENIKSILNAINAYNVDTSIFRQLLHSQR